jgi:Ras-related protein Rab-32
LLDLQDIAGQERFGNMTRVYYKDAVGCFIVFDVTRGSTFDAVAKWKTDLDNKVQLPDGNPVPCVLLANKVPVSRHNESTAVRTLSIFQCDMHREGLVNNAEEMDTFCREKGFTKWFETSAKENINIETSARFLISEVSCFE